MWPFKPLPREFLRAGRKKLERWIETSGRMECLAVHSLPDNWRVSMRTSSSKEFESALHLLYARKPTSAITLLIESALVPAMVVEAGPELWAPVHMHRLLRHRLAALYTEPGEPVENWNTRIDFRAGEPSALGFGMRASLKISLVNAFASAQIECRGMLPALAWGIKRLESVRQVPSTHWLAWAEQDRLLLARIKAGCVMSLNAAATLTPNSASIQRQVAVESVRRGIAGEAEIVATEWSKECVGIQTGKSFLSNAVKWIDVSGLRSESAMTELPMTGSTVQQT